MPAYSPDKLCFIWYWTTGSLLSRKCLQRQQMRLSRNGITGRSGPAALAALNVASTVFDGSRKQLVGGFLTGKDSSDWTHLGNVTGLTAVCWPRCWKIPGMSEEGWGKVLFPVVGGSSGWRRWVNVWLRVCDRAGGRWWMLRQGYYHGKSAGSVTHGTIDHTRPVID